MTGSHRKQKKAICRGVLSFILEHFDEPDLFVFRKSSHPSNPAMVFFFIVPYQPPQSKWYATSATRTTDTAPTVLELARTVAQFPRIPTNRRIKPHAQPYRPRHHRPRQEDEQRLPCRIVLVHITVCKTLHDEPSSTRELRRHDYLRFAHVHALPRSADHEYENAPVAISYSK